MITETLKRLKAKTPYYFRRLAAICISSAIAAAAALSFYNDSPVGKSFGPMPHWLEYAFHVIGIAGTVGTFISFLTVQDKAEIK